MQHAGRAAAQVRFCQAAFPIDSTWRSSSLFCWTAQTSRCSGLASGSLELTGVSHSHLEHPRVFASHGMLCVKDDGTFEALQHGILHCIRSGVFYISNDRDVCGCFWQAAAGGSEAAAAAAVPAAMTALSTTAQGAVGTRGWAAARAEAARAATTATTRGDGSAPTGQVRYA